MGKKNEIKFCLDQYNTQIGETKIWFTKNVKRWTNSSNSI